MVFVDHIFSSTKPHRIFFFHFPESIRDYGRESRLKSKQMLRLHEGYLPPQKMCLMQMMCRSCTHEVSGSWETAELNLAAGCTLVVSNPGLADSIRGFGSINQNLHVNLPCSWSRTLLPSQAVLYKQVNAMCGSKTKWFDRANRISVIHWGNQKCSWESSGSMHNVYRLIWAQCWQTG